MTTNESRKSFRKAVQSALENPSFDCIYAFHREGDKYLFSACNLAVLSEGDILWMTVEADSFGELSGDYEADAAWIEEELFEQAVNEVNDLFLEQDLA